jgi:hypothetical protein
MIRMEMQKGHGGEGGILSGALAPSLENTDLRFKLLVFRRCKSLSSFT